MTINYQFPNYPYNQFPNQNPNPYQKPYVNQNPYMNQYNTPTFSPQSNFRSFETSYVENILRMNLGKIATIYMNFENSQWGSKVFKGELLGAGRDHILLKDNQTGITYLLLRVYLSYVTFDEEVEYDYPFM